MARRILRGVFISLAVLAGLCVVLIVSAWLWVRSQAGQRYVLDRLRHELGSRAGVELEASRLSGSLLSSLRLEGVNLRACEQKLRVRAASVTIDFSQHGQGPFDQSFFSGVSFAEGTFVGYIQGDEALVGRAAGSIKNGFKSIAARVAPAIQGTAIYTLTAHSSSGRTLGSSSVTITQDTGDPETGPFGYESIELGPLPRKASSFRLSNTFVRSSYTHITQIEFGVSSITALR